MSAPDNSIRPVRLTLIWTEQAIAADPDHGSSAAKMSDDYPFDGPELDADRDTMVALAAAGVLSRLEKLPHEGMSLEDSHEEGWFDLDQLDGLIAAIETLLADQRAKTSAVAASGDLYVTRWLECALAFVHEAKRLNRGVCFWV